MGSTIRRYFTFIRSNNKALNKGFLSRNIGDFLTIVKKKKELHTFTNIKKTKTQIEVRKESVYGLTENEKMIILHVLLHRLSTEYFRVLALTSGSLIEKDIEKANTNYTKYIYFYKGVNASDKPSFEKVKMIEDILIKIESLKTIKKFKQALIRYKNLK
ncbi:hypothetical protein [Tenacibaculum piscium]|uniref:hypothetical protein n=1 Tax=Tenacibaculum piscium TaxID=1458515 RepID=UPI000C7CF5AD|nr:hypothetical protein [Tenacibaculum piscium]MBE7628411.1 hypothetical protein [Tenacibaculum piscium]MBE7669568.1 hypothetical protein [Tenacibaculum piscium]MBE7686287.1 hypothetical protein [Tenacibaculum piscium]MBE7689472.1 hypothetical protein [Tenacibaculum piscium]